MLLFVFDHVVEDGVGTFVAECLQLLTVVGDMAAFFNFQAPQRHADAAGAVGKRIGLAARAAMIDRLRSAQFEDATMPKGGMLPLGSRQMAQHLGAHRIGISVSQRLIGVVALHLGLPIAFQGCQNLLQPHPVQRFLGHSFLLAFC